MKKKPNPEPMTDVIERLKEVQTNANDYFVIVEAMNEIHSLRSRVSWMYEDAWQDGYKEGLEARDGREK